MQALFDIHQAAAHCTCSVRWVQRLAQREGIGQVQRKRYMFSSADLDRLKAIKQAGKRGNPNFTKEG